jgi:protein farnesyltransferase subunit beta
MPTDDVLTDTSLEQLKTEQELQQLLSLYISQPATSTSKAKASVLTTSNIALNHKAHIRWLAGLLQPLPPPYVSLDASRPWLLYWVTHSLAIMNAALDKDRKRRAVETIKSFYNKEQGGFGGGPGQMAHLAPTYASISALCYLDDGTGSAWNWIDRRVSLSLIRPYACLQCSSSSRQAIHDWMLTLKQPDGSFVMHVGGEVDVR